MHLKHFEFLIKIKFGISLKIMIASWNDNAKIVKMLVEQEGTDTNAKDISYFYLNLFRSFDVNKIWNSRSYYTDRSHTNPDSMCSFSSPRFPASRTPPLLACI